MSLLIPDVGKTELLKRVLFGRTGTITNATNATPIVITSNLHGLNNGDCVKIKDVGGNTAANTTAIVGLVTTNTFALYTTATGTGGGGIAGTGGYTSGGEWCLDGVEAWTLKLYSNNHTPSEADVAGTYTEASFTGYSAKTLNSFQSSVTDWTAPSLVSPTGAWAPGAQTQVAESTYVQQSWSPASSQTVYGYYVVGATSTILLFAELFASSKNLSSGDTLNLTPRFGAANAS
jgi:hypothetical protein